MPEAALPATAQGLRACSRDHFGLANHLAAALGESTDHDMKHLARLHLMRTLRTALFYGAMAHMEIF